MKVSELKIALEEEIDDIVDMSKFLRWLNDWKRKAIAKIKKIDPYRFLESTSFDLISDNWNEIEITLPNDLATVDRIEYIDHYSVSLKPIKIEKTIFDEKDYLSNLRWFRAWDNIAIRWLNEDITNAKLYYWTKMSKLNFEDWVTDDEIDLPDSAYDTILITYTLYRYYKSENMETDWKVFLEEFYLEIDEMIDDLVPVSEPVNLNVEVEDWINY